MAISSGVGKAATTAAKTGKTGKTTTTKVVAPKKPTAAQLAAEKKAAQLSLNTVTGNEPTVSLRNTLMPPMQADGTYSWNTPAPTAPAWSLETDPVYRSAMNAGESAFNYARNTALSEKQNTETALAKEKKAIGVNATEARRRTAGNYAARGMAGGAAGVASQAEARLNAEQIAAQTDLATQLKAVNDQFLSNYGDVTNANYDWTGTLVGQQYKTQAAQQALESALARYGTV